MRPCMGVVTSGTHAVVRCLFVSCRATDRSRSHCPLCRGFWLWVPPGFFGWFREGRSGTFEPVETPGPRPTLVCRGNALGSHRPGIYHDHSLAGSEYAGDSGQWGHPVQTLSCATAGNAACPHTAEHSPHGVAPTPRVTTASCGRTARAVERRERPERHRENGASRADSHCGQN